MIDRVLHEMDPLSLGSFAAVTTRNRVPFHPPVRLLQVASTKCGGYVSKQEPACAGIPMPPGNHMGHESIISSVHQRKLQAGRCGVKRHAIELVFNIRLADA